MTATEGGPALYGADAVGPAAGARRADGIALSGAPQLRTVLPLARVEALLLVRSLLVLAGLLAGGAVVWVLIWPAEPLWWSAAWRIGIGQTVVGMAVLVAAQLAAGRARRDGMADLYASFPATASTRTVAHLAGLVGAVPASVVLIGAAAAVQVLGAIGDPSIAVLAGGLVLVIAAGAAGIAIGTRLPHPLAGVLGAVVLLFTSATTHLASAGGIWLLPWEWAQDQLGSLPGPLAGYPPAGAHVLELAGLAVLAGIVALTVTAGRARPRAGLATAGILAVAVICLAGAVQLRPIPAAELNHLVREIADPASAQRCTTVSQVRYCLYPGFGRQLPVLEAPVSGVFAHLPARPDQPLTIRQVLSPSLLDSTLTRGHSRRQVSQWTAQLQRAPGNAATSSVIYLPVGSWPAAGGQLGDARFDVAMAAADWAVRLAPQSTGNPNGPLFLPCVPLDQAREAIAIWLAILATRPPAGELTDGLHVRGPQGGIGITGSEVRNTFVPDWNYPGENASYVTLAGVPQTTAAGYLLASAMTRQPEQKVARVLTDGWGRWLDWHTTDAQLAAALRISVPKVPASILPRHAQPGVRTEGPGPATGPNNPLCTA
jgi:hypothetical protein